MARSPATLAALACAAQLALPAPAALAHHGLERLSAGPAEPSATTPISEYRGRIAELVVDDRVLGTTIRYVGLALDGGPVLRLRGEALAPLSTGMRVAIDGQREQQTLFVRASRVLDLNATAAGGTARKKTALVEGRYTVIHADDFDGGNSRFEHAVLQDDGSTTLVDFNVMPDVLASGMRVQVEGTRDATTIAAERVTILALARGATDVSPLATSNVLVMLVKFSDTVSDPFTQVQAQTAVFGGAGTNSVAQYYRDNSYGQQTLTGTVTPWLALTTPRPATCDYLGVGAAADTAANAAGFNVGAYTHRVYIFPRISACGWSGLAYIGVGRAYINQSLNLLVIAHELGHNFGALHAASVDCGAASIGGTCTSAEYGDEWNVMGNRRAMHMTAFQKLDIGWITAGQVATHTAGVSTYTLDPLETAGGTTYAVKVPARADRTYWLEFRQPIGFDSGLSSFANNGAQVRVATPFESLCSGCADDTELLDMTPSTAAMTDGTLVAGKTYSDWDTGTNISVVAATPTSLQVRVARTAPRKRLDMNRDLNTDLVWRNQATGATSLWLMSGTTLSSGAQLMSDPNWRVTHFGDFDGDRRADLVWRNDTTGGTAIWLMNGTTLSGGATVMTNVQWRVTHVADLNGDGKSDLVWRNDATGATAVWIMSGATMTAGAVLLVDPNWLVALTGDFNGDGRNDLLFRNSATGAAAIWLMNGAAASSAAQVLATPGWLPTHAADFDGDGRVDLLWHNAATGATSMWLMNGVVRASGVGLLTHVDWKVTHVGDFNGDGNADLVWRNSSTGETAMWLMSGTSVASTTSLGTDPDWQVTNVIDQNGDSRADLAWHNTATGVTSLWVMNGAAMASSATAMTQPAWRLVDVQ